MKMIVGYTEGWNKIKVIDINTNSEIKHCVEADDETGYFKKIDTRNWVDDFPVQNSVNNIEYVSGYTKLKFVHDSK